MGFEMSEIAGSVLYSSHQKTLLLNIHIYCIYKVYSVVSFRKEYGKSRVLIELEYLLTSSIRYFGTLVFNFVICIYLFLSPTVMINESKIKSLKKRIFP